ncbi:glycoside hydrolase family 10 protein [Anabaena aphanizomenioides LEGE 00250]|uniref:Glycoside hydrolase family 10 protein n=1 Tax=Sphaerospermopsis aphanizomenoides LEGE 00250 TaxID=2777972 RepID=A0ABR9VGX3_9CYAN|nr:glycoside hydrolase family 10 protein [Sphaerospermopsis aphanizomenoides]MBE9237357.1 glycoside hydrolase family 10 protein [Sphaerospermopsis aphanizomenoides LEGE 00250]
MNRVIHRCFSFLICLGFIFSLTIFPISSTSIVSQKTSFLTTEVRGVWLTNVASGVLFVPWGVERAINQLAALNFNTIYPVVWNRGYTFYKSKVAESIIGEKTEPLLNFINSGNDVLEKLVRLAKNKNLSVIPWFEYGFMTPPNSALAKAHPEWLTSGQKGINSVHENLPEEINQNGVFNRQVWLNPLHPQVQEFILGLILEVVKNYDVDGIQVDDHFGMPVEFGYDSFTVKLYQKEHLGKTPPTDPYDAKWMQWRADKITNFMGRINQAVKKIKPQAKISLSPNSQYFAYKYYLQDWENWVNKGWVDELILQVYRDDKKSFIAEIEKPAVKLAMKKIPVSIGISTGTLLSPVDIESIKEQVQIVRDHKFFGFSFFYWESLWGYISPESPQKRRKAFLEMFANKAVKPLNLNRTYVRLD